MMITIEYFSSGKREKNMKPDKGNQMLSILTEMKHTLFRLIRQHSPETQHDLVLF